MSADVIRCLEPISKSPEDDDEASELDEAEAARIKLDCQILEETRIYRN